MKSKAKTLEKVNQKIIKALKKTKKQFYSEDGKEITVEEYVELLKKEDPKDLKAFLNKMKRMRKIK